MLSIVILAITSVAFTWYWKRRHTVSLGHPIFSTQYLIDGTIFQVPVSEIQHLRERVQFCNRDMAVLQNTLDTALLSKRATESFVATNEKLIDALLDPVAEKPNEDESEPEKQVPPEAPEVEATSESETSEPSNSMAEDTKPKPIPTVQVLGSAAKSPGKEKSAEEEPVKSTMATRVDNKRKSPSRNGGRPARDLKETNLSRPNTAGQAQARNRVRLVKSAPTYRNEKI